MNKDTTNIQLRQPWVALGFPPRGGKRMWEAALKDILHETPTGKEVIGLDHSYLMAAFACHPEREEKEGVGFSHFETGPGPDKYGSTCFHAVRMDGTHATFSIRACLGGKASPWTAFSSALRDCVSYDILDWKNKNKGQCALCGCTPTWQNTHADHVHPLTFNALAKGFVEDASVDLDHVQYRESPMWELADDELASAWVKYHREKAVLRILCASCNTRIGARSAA